MNGIIFLVKQWDTDLNFIHLVSMVLKLQLIQQKLVIFRIYETPQFTFSEELSKVYNFWCCNSHNTYLKNMLWTCYSIILGGNVYLFI